MKLGRTLMECMYMWTACFEGIRGPMKRLLQIKLSGAIFLDTLVSVYSNVLLIKSNMTRGSSSRTFVDSR